MVAPVEIDGRLVGPGHPCLIVAEIGVNHNGDPELAHRLVDAAADAGADAVKLQTFRAERVATVAAPKAGYQRATTDEAQSQLEMLRRLELPRDALAGVQAHASERGLVFLSAPFDFESVDVLDELGVPAFKVASGELTNWPFLEHIARKGRPVVLSTGMSYLVEVEAAVRVLRAAGADGIVLLHCVSEYPAPVEEANLRAMATLEAACGTPVGFSDHTLGFEASLAAVALGAAVIEKHLTLDRTLPGPDHPASLEPAALRALVRGIRDVERALGDGTKEPAPSELGNRDVVRRSLAAAADIPLGAVVAAEHVTALRPGTGIEPARLVEVVGRTATRRIAAGELLRLEDLA